MEYAEAYATGEAPDFEAARFWLDFARELRTEHYQRLAHEAVWPRAAEKQSPAETVVMTVPDGRPGDATEAVGDCARCGYAVKWGSAGPDGIGELVHTRTGRAVCPVPVGLDETYTFATLRN